jgi:hypothetical protein
VVPQNALDWPERTLTTRLCDNAVEENLLGKLVQRVHRTLEAASAMRERQWLVCLRSVVIHATRIEQQGVKHGLQASRCRPHLLADLAHDSRSVMEQRCVLRKRCSATPCAGVPRVVPEHFTGLFPLHRLVRAVLVISPPEQLVALVEERVKAPVRLTLVVTLAVLVDV